MSDWNDLVRFSKTRLSTAILRYPSGRFGIVGAIPMDCTEPDTKSLTPGVRKSKTFSTELEAAAAIVAAGVTRFQMADCSWNTDSKAVAS